MKRILFLVLAVSIISCKNSVEKQSNNWSSNITKVQKLAEKYPHYATLIQNQFDQAEADMEKALEITDEETKMSAMAEANKKVKQGIIGSIEDLENNIESIDRTYDKIIKEFDRDNFDNKTTFLLNDARETKEEAERLLNNDNSQKVNLLSLMQSQNSKLKNIDDNLSKYYRDTKSQIDEDLKDRPAVDDVPIDIEENQETAMITCSKCGSKISKNASKCSQCGAPIK